MKKKILTTKELILSIMGIILLTCLIVLPPVFRVVFEEPEPVDPNVKGPILSLSCTKKGIKSSKYTDNKVYAFKYQDGNILSYVDETERIYYDSTVYQAEKVNYGKLVTALTIIEGYTYTITPVDNTSSVNIKEEFDLNTFKDTSVTIPGETEPIEIKSKYTSDLKMEDIQISLVAQGYTCK